MKVLRWVEWVSRLDKVRNVNLRGRLQPKGVLRMVKRWQQNWKQRVKEMSSKSDKNGLYW